MIHQRGEASLLSGSDSERRTGAFLKLVLTISPRLRVNPIPEPVTSVPADHRTNPFCSFWVLADCYCTLHPLIRPSWRVVGYKRTSLSLPLVE
jgi:hypothetical protein